MPRSSIDSLTKKQLVGKLNELTSRVDGWGNLFTGFGISGVDKKQSTTFSLGKALAKPTLEALYRQDGLARQVLSLPVNDMVRKWFKVEGDTDNYIIGELDKLKARQVFRTAVQWGDLYGGSLIVMGLDDGQEMKLPLNETLLKSVKFLRVHDRYDITWNSGQLYTDPASEKFGLPEVYDINNLSTGVTYQVHETRTLRFEGMDVPESVRVANQGWGDSVYDCYVPRLRGLGEAYENIEHIISEFIIGILSIDGLQDLISSGQEDLIKRRLNLIDLSKHVINSILLDTTEKMERISSSVTGLEGMVAKLEGALCAITGIPQVLLFGEQSKGLGGESAGSIRLYYDDILSRQEDELRSPLERLCYLVQISSEGELHGTEIEGWNLCFNPLWQPTESEIVKTRAEQAKTDEVYINTGVLTPSEVKASRFGGESYSLDTDIDDEEAAEPTITTPPTE